MRYSFVTALVLSTFSLSTYAATSTHVIGTTLGYGMVNYDAPTSEESGDMFLGEIYYRYMPTHNFGIEAGYKGAFDGIGSILVSPISEVTNTRFSGPRLSGYASYPLGAGFEVYGKAGVTYYTLAYTYSVNGQSRDIEKSSLGGEAAAGLGWSYTHFGLNAEYVYSKNSDFDSGGVMFGAQLRF